MPSSWIYKEFPEWSRHNGPKFELPGLKSEAVDRLKVEIPANESQVMIQAEGCNPHVVLWNWTAFLAQPVLDFAEAACGSGIAVQDYNESR